MLYKNNLIRYFAVQIIMVVIATSCSPSIPVEGTQALGNITESETLEATTPEIKNTPTIPANTPTATVTITPSPTTPPSPTATLTLTPSLLQKIDDLPLGNVPFPELGITEDGTLLAISTLNTNDAPFIFDMSDQTIKREIVEGEMGVMSGYSSLTFSTDGRYLAGWNGGWTVFVWDMDNGEILHKIQFERDDEVEVDNISFSPDGQLLAFSSMGGGAFMYDMETGKSVDTLPSVTYLLANDDNHTLGPGGISYVKFIPNYTNLLALAVYGSPFVDGEATTGGLYFWDVKSQHSEGIITGTGGYTILSSPDGKFVVVRVNKRFVGWDILNNREVFAIEHVERSGLVSNASVDFFATLSEDEGLKIWNYNGELITTLHPDKKILDVVFTPENRLIISYSNESSPIEVWKIQE